MVETVKKFEDNLTQEPSRNIEKKFEGNEDVLIEVFTSAVELLHKEREAKIVANNIKKESMFDRTPENIKFLQEQNSKTVHTIQQTIKHILAIEKFVPSKDTLNKQIVRDLQEEKDLIEDTKDALLAQAAQLNIEGGEINQEEIARINEKIRKISYVSRALTVYMREYNLLLIEEAEKKKQSHNYS